MTRIHTIRLKKIVSLAGSRGSIKLLFAATYKATAPAILLKQQSLIHIVSACVCVCVCALWHFFSLHTAYFIYKYSTHVKYILLLILHEFVFNSVSIHSDSPISIMTFKGTQCFKFQS